MIKIPIEINGLKFNVWNGIDISQFSTSYNIVIKGSSLGCDSDWYIIDDTHGVSLLDKILVATGHDVSKIDRAVPQDWYEERHRRFGVYPRAMWTHELDEAFGEPLFLDSVDISFAMMAVASLRERISDAVQRVYGVSL